MKTLARQSDDNVFLICRMGDMSYTLHLEQGSLAIPAYASLVGTTRLLGLGTGSMALLAAYQTTCSVSICSVIAPPTKRIVLHP